MRSPVVAVAVAVVAVVVVVVATLAAPATAYGPAVIALHIASMDSASYALDIDAQPTQMNVALAGGPVFSRSRLLTYVQATPANGAPSVRVDWRVTEQLDAGDVDAVVAQNYTTFLAPLDAATPQSVLYVKRDGLPPAAFVRTENCTEYGNSTFVVVARGRVDGALGERTLFVFANDELVGTLLADDTGALETPVERFAALRVATLDAGTTSNFSTVAEWTAPAPQLGAVFFGFEQSAANVSELVPFGAWVACSNVAAVRLVNAASEARAVTMSMTPFANTGAVVPSRLQTLAVGGRSGAETTALLDAAYDTSVGFAQATFADLEQLLARRDTAGLALPLAHTDSVALGGVSPFIATPAGIRSFLLTVVDASGAEQLYVTQPIALLAEQSHTLAVSQLPHDTITELAATPYSGVDVPLPSANTATLRFADGLANYNTPGVPPQLLVQLTNSSGGVVFQRLLDAGYASEYVDVPTSGDAAPISLNAVSTIAGSPLRSINTELNLTSAETVSFFFFGNTTFLNFTQADAAGQKPKPAGRRGLSTGAIVGIAMGSILALILVFSLIMYVKRDTTTTHAYEPLR